MSRPCRVLVVDDFPDAREMYREYLGAMGFDVVEADNGLAAIERALDSSPDVILMDMALPVLDGLEATRRLKADGRTAGIPVVALSGYEAPAGINRKHYASFLMKPCLPEDVLKAIRQALDATPPPPAASTPPSHQS
jgi:two-component system cell cycle response regulator DivK